MSLSGKLDLTTVLITHKSTGVITAQDMRHKAASPP
jgi:hypothetical protein